jgi:hypothetical protein
MDAGPSQGSARPYLRICAIASEGYASVLIYKGNYLRRVDSALVPFLSVAVLPRRPPTCHALRIWNFGNLYPL